MESNIRILELEQWIVEFEDTFSRGGGQFNVSRSLCGHTWQRSLFAVPRPR